MWKKVTNPCNPSLTNLLNPHPYLKDRDALAAEGVIELLMILLKSKDEIIVSSCGRALVNLGAESKVALGQG